MLGCKSSSTKSENEQTSISLSNETESIIKQEPMKQVNIVISYIEQNDEQGIGKSVKNHIICTFYLKLNIEIRRNWHKFHNFWYILKFTNCVK